MMHVFILNVNAGKNNSYLIGKIIEEYCKLQRVNYFVNYSYTKEDTEQIVNKYKSLDDVVIYSVGGDGTLNQVINSIANTNLSLNVIPCGTGNDFYRSLNIYDGTTIDLGKVNDKHFINVASFGIDAEIANTANILKNKNIKGSLVYPLSILKNYFIYKSKEINIDKKNKSITLLAICNGKFYGGGFKISPNSVLNDGLFDVYEVEDINKLKTLNLLLKLLKGKHINDNLVKVYKSDSLEINSSTELICNLDGEIIKGTDFKFSISKGAIKLDDDKLKIKELLKYKRIIK